MQAAPLLPYARTGLKTITAGMAAAAQDAVVEQGEAPIAFQTVPGETVIEHWLVTPALRFDR